MRLVTRWLSSPLMALKMWHPPNKPPITLTMSFTKDNPGWEILYSWFHDALLQKNGIIKVWWDEYPENPQREEYRNLGEMEFEYLISDDEP